MRRASICILVFFVASVTAFAQGPLPAVFDKAAPESVHDLQQIEEHVQKLIERVLPATVCLRIGNAQGSGVIIDRDGHILTAGHVTGSANREAIVIMPDGRRFTGKTLGANNGIDSGMAILTDKANFPRLDMARSSELKKGQWCLALGHPNGHKPGRPPVARLGRIQFVSDKGIMTDCVLVGGDSGGPLFDMHGRVIGIHSRIGKTLEANVHVPIDTYRDTWTRLAAGEVWGQPNPLFAVLKPAQPYLGMRVVSEKGTLKVEAATPGSPAFAAGLKPGDTIVKVDNQVFSSADEFAAFIGSQRPGNRIAIQVERGSSTISVSVTLGKREN